MQGFVSLCHGQSRQFLVTCRDMYKRADEDKKKEKNNEKYKGDFKFFDLVLVHRLIIFNL